MASSIGSCCFALLLLCFCRQFPSSEPKSLILPLQIQKIPPVSPPSRRPSSRLRFRHNVTLTVTLAVGSPPQNVTMVLDTGSELSWLLCSNGSRSAGPAADTAPYFRPRSSASYAPVPCSSPTCLSKARDLPTPAACDPSSRLCRVSLSYADASSSDGVLAADDFAVGSPPSSSARTVFACVDPAASYSSSPDADRTAGLLGMNRGALSFVTQTDTRRFSYCIPDRDGSGLLLIGEQINRTFSVPLNYTPLVQMSLPLPYFDRVAYSVQLEGIRVGGVLLPIPKSVLEPDHTGAGQTMVDSGTQFTFLLGPAYGALKAEFLNQTRGVLAPLGDPDFVFQGALDACFKNIGGVGVTGLRVPGVDLVFRGAEVRVGKERLLYRVGPGVWCLTFGNSDLVPVEAYVIGHHHQTNVWVEYDLERGRVGFGPARCDQASQKLGLVGL